MTAQLKEYQAYLGAPTQVKRGDSHSQLALDYLTKQAGLAQPQAEAVLRQTALAWDLEPGNQVYSLYRDGLLLTTVTQGTAARPPLLAQSAQRRALQAKAQGLEAQLRECEAKEKAPQ
jgi:chromosome segregation ATPase